MRGLIAATLLSLLDSAAAIDTSTVGAALESPATGTVRTGTNSVSAYLAIAECTYVGPAVTQKTRCYNGALPGPTFYLKPGDTFTLTLSNQLDAETHDTSTLHNTYRDFDKTNVHTHGLHIGSTAPGDDVFTEVPAGTNYTYTYTIPAEHMGGTFWYHPHHHGSTAIQVSANLCPNPSPCPNTDLLVSPASSRQHRHPS